MAAAAVAASGHNQHKQQHTHNPNRPPNRNQIFDSSGPDVRVRGNAHQVFDKYQALAREAAASGDRIAAEAYWQYADHYYRVIQTHGRLRPARNNQGWGEGEARTASAAAGQSGSSRASPAATQQANGSKRLRPASRSRPIAKDGRDDQGGRDRQQDEP